MIWIHSFWHRSLSLSFFYIRLNFISKEGERDIGRKAKGTDLAHCEINEINASFIIEILSIKSILSRLSQTRRKVKKLNLGTKAKSGINV